MWSEQLQCEHHLHLSWMGPDVRSCV
jgi:hypothetical protein